MTKGRDFVANQIWIKFRMITVNIACFFKRTHTSETGWGRDPHPLSQSHVGDPSLIAKNSQDLEVDFIKRSAWHSGPPKFSSYLAQIPERKLLHKEIFYQNTYNVDFVFEGLLR